MSACSTEEDTEGLRELVAASLEKDGVLGRIKAQLRAHVYLSLESGHKARAAAQDSNPRLAAFLATTNGRLVASLVREFLQFFDLDSSLAVFDPETNLGREVQYRERGRLTSALGLTELTDPQAPLLSEIMRLSKVSVLKSESPTPSSLSSQHTSPPASLAEDPPSLTRDPPSLTRDPPSLSRDPPSLSSPREAPGATRPGQGREVASARPQARPLESAPLSKPLESASLSKPLESAPLSRPLEPPQLAKPPSFLSDLPPLGRPGLGELPPLGAPPARGLRPLKQGRPGGEAREGLVDQVKSKVEEKEAKVAGEVRRAEEVRKVEEVRSSPEVTEAIEEELDSLLNSSLSSAAEVTRDETVASDASLRVDYMEGS